MNAGARSTPATRINGFSFSRNAPLAAGLVHADALLNDEHYLLEPESPPALERVEQAVPQAAGPIINNNNNITNSNVINLNFAQVLESLATEIEKHNPVEGRSFRATIGRWLKDPELWTAIVKAGQATLTSQS
jgi:hypothetical protein